MPPTKGTAPIKPFLKWKPTDKGNRLAKKPKEVVTAIVGEKSGSVQVPLPRHGAGKGLMRAPGPTLKKRPLSSIMDFVTRWGSYHPLLRTMITRT